MSNSGKLASLTGKLFAGVLLLITFNVYANEPAIDSWWNSGISAIQHPNAAAACQEVFNFNPNWPTNGWELYNTIENGDIGTCQRQCLSDYSPCGQSWLIHSFATVNKEHVCNPGLIWDTSLQICAPEPVCEESAGTGPEIFFKFDGTTDAPSTFCHSNNCTYGLLGVGVATVDPPAAFGSYSSTGAYCPTPDNGMTAQSIKQPSTEPAPTTAPSRGTVSVVEITKGTETTTGSETAQTTPNPDGTSTTTTTKNETTTINNTTTGTYDFTLDQSSVVDAINQANTDIVGAINGQGASDNQGVIDAINGNPGAADQANIGSSYDDQAVHDAINSALNDAVLADDFDESEFNSMWLWQPPQSAVCTPYSGTVAGQVISFDLCPTIDLIRSVIGWIFAVFGLVSIFQVATRS